MAKEKVQKEPEYYKELISRLLVEIAENIRSAGGAELVEFWTTTSDDIFSAMQGLTADDIDGMCQHMPSEAAQSVAPLLASMPENKGSNQEARQRGLVARLIGVLVFAKLGEEGENKSTVLGLPIDEVAAKTEVGMPIPLVAAPPRTTEPSFVIQDGVATEEANPPAPAVTAEPTAATSELATAGNTSPVADAPRHPPGQGQQPAQDHPRQITGDRAHWPPPPAEGGAITTTVERLNALPAGATRWQRLWAGRRVITLALIILMPSLLIAAVIIMMSYYKR
jgi:hypothetical protein